MSADGSDFLDVLSTRLFPKYKGARSYRLTGIAARCDWVILSDSESPHIHFVGNAQVQPRTIFVSLRAPFDAIAYFFSEILPRIEQPFVLITGSEDATLPNQIDQRWRAFNQQERQCISDLLADSRLIHWFAENLDAVHPRISPLPLGLLPSDDGATSVPVPISPPLSDRKLNVFCAHRVRSGAQWDERRRVSELCRSDFQTFCTLVEQPMPEQEFVRQIESHAFVLCISGGGLDPSPKAWQTLLHGAIPIIRSSPLDDAYRQLPVVFIDDWKSDSLSKKLLGEWLERLRSFYDDADRRRCVLNRLGLDYWWAQVLLMYFRGTRCSDASEGTLTGGRRKAQ